jgi:hypothetical protein
MRVTELNIGTDFLPTGLVHNQDNAVYVKCVLPNQTVKKLPIKLIKGTNEYCILDDEYFILNNYNPYIKFYKMVKGNFTCHRKQPVLQYSDKIWYRFAQSGENAVDYNSESLISQESVESGGIIYYDQNPDLFLKNEYVKIYSQNIVTKKSKFKYYFQSFTTFELVYPITVVKSDKSPIALIIPAKDGLYFKDKQRVDYIQKFVDDIYFTIDLSQQELDTLNLQKIEFEEVGIEKYTPITYYKLQNKFWFLHFSILLFGIFLFASIPINLFNIVSA